MSSPTVSTFQSGSVGISIARLVLPQADGNAPVMYFDLALGRGQLEDQHVLGQPALVAGHHRGDPQREALLAEQGVAAVARAVRPDLARLRVSGRCTCCRRCRARRRPRRPSVSGIPTECTQGTNSPSSPSTSSAGLAHPGHDPHRDRDVGRVGQLHADFGDRRSRAGPSRRAPRTSCGRPWSPRRSRSASRASPLGSRQLLVGPASSSFSEQMKVRSSTRATSPGSESAR